MPTSKSIFVILILEKNIHYGWHFGKEPGMLINRKRTEPFNTKYELDNASIDKVSLRVQKFLMSLKSEKSSILRVRLSVEEVLLRWADHFPAHTQFRLEMGTHWNRPYIMLKLTGEECNPMSGIETETDLWASDLIRTLGLSPVYQYISGCNVVQFPVKKPQRNPGVTLLICTLVGSLLGIVFDLAFPRDVQMLVTDTVLTPLQDAFIRTLNAVSAPVMFLSVLTAVCAVGSSAVSGRIGKRLVTRFLLYSTLFTVGIMFLSQFCFKLPAGESTITHREVSGVLDFFLDVLPGDILSPFIQGDFTQLIIVALILGNAFLIAGPKAQALSSLVDEAYTVGLIVAEWIGDLSPGFVALLIVLGIQEDTIHMLLGIWKPILLITIAALLVMLLRMLQVGLRFKVPVRTLWLKMRESFLLSLRTLSIQSSYSANEKCCENNLGISPQLTAYSLPIGLICFMPVSTVASVLLTLYAAECYSVPVSLVWMIMALFLAVTLGAAGPPTAGIGILTYTVMFAKLGIPTQGLTLVLAGDILIGFVTYPINQALLQLELVLEADKLEVLNKKTLRQSAK